jgi:hypothetical protein
MAQYATLLARTASTTASLGEIHAGGTPRRGFIYEFMLGSEATAADNPFLYSIQRETAGGTGTAVTPVSLDPADTVASNAVAQQNMTIEPTFPPTLLVRLALNQRATFRWVAQPGSELVYPATQNSGICYSTPTATAVAISATIFHRE